MTSLPAEIYSVATVREIDRTAIEGGIPGYTLMTRAGTAAFLAARERFPQATRWQVVCGAGNNAGDGYVVARLAAAEGLAVSVVTLADPASLKGDAATAHSDFAAEGGVAESWSGELDADAGLLVDALLGSGLERDVEGEFAKAVRAIEAHRAPVLAIDIPTGLHGDSGRVLGCAVSADLTITFVGLKTGMFLGHGPDLCGEIVVAGLDLPEAARRGKAVAYRRIDDRLLRRALAPRGRAAHKGDFGHVLVIGGGAGMPGAVRLCGEAALRSGAGLVSIATHPDHAAFVATARPELMPHAIEKPADLEPLLARADVVAFGPGLGRSDWAGALFTALAGRDGPCVWDADALNWLAEMPGRSDSRIITPHPGEAARLLNTTAAAVQEDRRAALDALAETCGGTVVLKGAGSLVSAGAGVAPRLCSAGNPGMASAGMGDVLTGIIAALLAQGLDAPDAAAVGVEVHARAGDRAAARGERGLIASDLLAELRGIVNP
jgi:ADP-dependent NAD(P)H-hydrate dehydratase / NAD(P)H-hydrate epimerase